MPPLGIREIENENTILKYYTPTIMAKTWKTDETQCWQKDKGTSRWWDCKMVKSHWKIVCHFFMKLNTHLLYNSAIPCLGVYPSEINTYIHKRLICELRLHYSQLHYSNIWNNLHVHQLVNRFLKIE